MRNCKFNLKNKGNDDLNNLSILQLNEENIVTANSITNNLELNIQKNIIETPVKKNKNKTLK